MGYINSKTFTIGTGNGQYDGTTGKITDTLLSNAVSSILVDSTPYQSGYSIASTTLDISALYTPPLDNGTMITVNFTSPIYINSSNG